MIIVSICQYNIFNIIYMANLSLYVYHVITIYGLSIFFLRFLGLRSPGFTSQELQQKTPKKTSVPRSWMLGVPSAIRKPMETSICVLDVCFRFFCMFFCFWMYVLIYAFLYVLVVFCFGHMCNLSSLHSCWWFIDLLRVIHLHPICVLYFYRCNRH